MGSHIQTLYKNVRNPTPDNMVVNGVDCNDKQVIAITLIICLLQLTS